MTTIEQWEHMARETNAAAVKAMAEADRLRAELARIHALADRADNGLHGFAVPVTVLRAAGGQEEAGRCQWCNHAAHFPAACTKDAAPQHPGYECNCCGDGDMRPEVLAALAHGPGKPKPNGCGGCTSALCIVDGCRLGAAAPVGGQAEPSDAQTLDSIEAIREHMVPLNEAGKTQPVLDRTGEFRVIYEDDRGDLYASRPPQDDDTSPADCVRPIEWLARYHLPLTVLVPAAAVSGEQAAPTERNAP